ncbi:threonine/serine exporter family protein [Peptoniphilus sp.]|jgi:uncharacterized membrane protein YjjB (DUF3815 family)|uniref:threonine/serine exporter family protein n=1 Tax=Peptoniphilus sp. TaxID=1971214 RepID=UPI003D946659
MNYFLEFFVACFGTFGFTIYFKLPKNVRGTVSILSGLIWVTYKYILINTNNYLIAGLLASIIIGVISETLAIYFKKPATVFSLPCLIPLVPGAGMYYIMYYFIESDYDMMTTSLINTVLTTTGLALGIISSQATFRLFRQLVKEKKNLR